MNKTIFITGSTDGIGKELAVKLIQSGFNVILHGRSIQKLNETIKEIKNRTSQVCKGYIADLSNFQEVVSMCKSIESEIESLNVVVHNAGTFEKFYQVNKDNIEKTMAVNYVSNVLINELLLNYFKKNTEQRKKNHEPLRIILVSSIAHQGSTFSINSWFKNSRNSYDAYKAYANSKMAQIMYCYYIADFLKEDFITINALHPGVIHTKILTENFGIQGRPISEGIETPYYLATSKDVKNITGKYFVNKNIEKSSNETYKKEYQELLYKNTKEIISKYLRNAFIN